MAADGKEDIPDYDLSKPAAPLGRVTELGMASCFGVVGLALVAIASGFLAKNRRPRPHDRGHRMPLVWRLCN